MESHSSPVVVGIDDKQPTALRFALAEAHRRATDLRVVHSATVPAAEFYVAADVVEEIRDAGRKVLHDAQHFIEQEVTPVPVEYVLTVSPPIEALDVEAQEASIVVIGTDDISWPDRLLGGAIASRTALHAACPVIVVPERSYPTPLSGGVVVALDGDTPASGPLRFAFEQAGGRGNVLHVLHAIPEGTTRPDVEAVRANLGEILAGWSDTFPTVRVQLSFPIDEAEDACARATEQAELVVVGRPHRHALPYALARPLAAEVLRHAHCPVAVVPADYQGA